MDMNRVFNRDKARKALQVPGSWTSFNGLFVCREYDSNDELFECEDPGGYMQVFTRDIEAALDFLETGEPIPENKVV